MQVNVGNSVISLLIATSVSEVNQVAVWSNDESIVWTRRARVLVGLHHQINLVLDGLGLGYAQLSRIYVDLGPGHWTSLNAGVVTAKTTASLISAELVGFGRLEVMLNQIPNSTAAILKAGPRAYFYCEKDRLPTQPTSIVRVDNLELLLDRFPPESLLAVDDATAADLQHLETVSWHVVPSLPDPKILEEMLDRRELEALSGDDVHAVVPIYEDTDPSVHLSEGSFR